MKHTLRGLMAGVVAVGCCATVHAAYKFDFGAAGTESGYTTVGITSYSAGQGYGWLSTSGLNLRDRSVPDALRTDFIFDNTTVGNTFRVSGLTPNGKYLMKVLCGDDAYGDHIITVSVPGAGTLPTLSPHNAEYLELSATVDADVSGTLDITFGSPTPNWVVNALTLEPATTNITPSVESSYVNEWDPAVFATDPTAALTNGFNGTGAVDFADTGVTRDDYLSLIASEIDFWKTKQDSNGAIIDPYRGVETQYATPAFANAAAALVVYAGRTDLLEAAAKAVDWASYRLSINSGADGHDDFYPGMLANAYRLLSPLVSSSRAATWSSNLGYDPWTIYDYAPGSFNWTVVSSCGDALLQLLGIRSTSNSYVAVCWGAQGNHFTSPYGLYEEGPMAYDHFPRIWFEDALAQGYSGPFSTEVSEAMDRAAITSLFMESPWGELPAGGRSAHHQWNEAEQCITYEIYAGKAKAAGNTLMAAAYKRAAHLAFSSMQRWVNSDGAMQVVKNWVDPASRHGYESYSYYSQYNLLPMAMLAIAYEHAASSEDVSEGPAPADTGGFILHLDGLHKVFANAGGTYIEIDTSGDHHYDATGLIRVHQEGLSPQLGPSDSLLSGASYNSPNPSPITTGVGVSWLDTDGTTWRTLGEMNSASVTVTPVSQSTTEVVFDVTYAGNLPNVSSVTEHYVVTPGGVNLTTQLSGYSGALRYVWPALSNDGETQSNIGVDGNTVSVSQGDAAETFTASGAQSVRVESPEYSNHNGWARLGIAEYPSGGAITLSIARQVPDAKILSKSPTGDIYDTTPTLKADIEDGQVAVDPNQVALLVDGSPVAPESISKVGTTTTVSGVVSSPLAYGMHTAGVVAGPSTQTNSWTFNVVPLPPVQLGAITYIDANSGSSGNTKQWDGSFWVTFSPPLNVSSTADNQWEEETGYGNGPTQNWFESNREGTPSNEDCPQLRTSVTGLPNQTYGVYAYFWVANGQGFKFGAALTNNPTGSLPLYAVGDQGVAAADAAAFKNTVMVTSADRTLYQVTLGTVTGTSVNVYIDDDAYGGYNSSCWYDGIGYAPCVTTTPTDVGVAVSNDVVAISWPGTHVGWILQSSTNLGDGIWTDVGGLTSNTTYSIIDGNLLDSEFFRIRYPLP